MTPAARVAAAIEILDRVLSGEAAEKALTTWGRANRFAGSKDRAAIRDHVFDAIRQRRSFAMWGGAETGRGLMLGWVRATGADMSQAFSGQGYGPPPPSPDEAGYAPPAIDDWPAPVRYDYPDWLAPQLEASLEADLPAVMAVMQARAPVHLRVNTLKTTSDAAVAALREDTIAAFAHPLADTALEVTENARRLRQSRAYTDGLVELQDAASQALVARLGPPIGAGRALDYCAGGGGKALAMAAFGWSVTAHDAAPDRMKDIPDRAARAGAAIDVKAPKDLDPKARFDLVLVDAPCSGSGAWRRQPEARWDLTADRLADLTALQDQILDHAVGHVAPQGHLAYATCSLLRAENQGRLSAFLGRHPDWHILAERAFSPLEGGDGFYVSILEKR
ncbi:MAG: RsmB/NOP family class I SAM-dependent RNA methyltransferase [Pseudomonadota bacterium]